MTVAVALVLALCGAGVVAGSALIAAAGGAPGAAAVARESWTATREGAATSGVGSSFGSIAGRVAVSPVVIDLVVAPPKPRATTPVEVTATALNLSSSRVPELVLSLAALPASLTIRPAEQRPIRNLGPSRSVVQTWIICSRLGGTFELVARATVGDTITTSTPIAVTLAPSSRC